MGRDQRLEVVAAVVEHAGRRLVARRATGARAGRWEFPGGKVRAGESHAAALRRELDEELGYAVAVADRIGTVCHRYPDLTVDLHAYRCAPADTGEPRLKSGDHDHLRWLTLGELAAIDLCEADQGILAVLEARAPRGPSAPCPPT